MPLRVGEEVQALLRSELSLTGCRADRPFRARHDTVLFAATMNSSLYSDCAALAPGNKND